MGELVVNLIAKLKIVNKSNNIRDLLGPYMANFSSIEMKNCIRTTNAKKLSRDLGFYGFFSFNPNDNFDLLSYNYMPMSRDNN